jgi:hypothetical protein
MPTYNNELDGLNESKFSLPSIRLIPEICCYIRPGVVRDALLDLEMIRTAGVEGLEPVFELLKSGSPEPFREGTDANI